MMETVLYEDFPTNYYPATMNMNSMKRKLTLNLNMDTSGDKNSVIKKAKVASLNTPIMPILNTPDLAKCKLDTPDLERVIVQQISSLPTPNVNANQMFFSESETSEAKAASAEFEQALSNVRSQHERTILQNTIVNTMDSAIIPTTIGTAIKIKKDPMLSDAMLMGTVPHSCGGTSVISTGLTPLLESVPSYIRLQYNTYDSDLSQDTENSGSTSSSLATSYLPTYTTASHMTAVPVTLSTTSSAGLHKLPDYTTVSAAGNLVRVPVSNDYGLVTTTVDYTPVDQSMTIIKEEFQTVPQADSPSSVSPINMEDQEKIKLERKRQRNRVAASKCRQRKLERISKLEGKVKQLKNENNELSSLSAKLRDQVLQLKQQINSHAQNGCQIMMPQQGVQQNSYLCM